MYYFSNVYVQDWPRAVYHTMFREPIYKGGRVKERVPGWCDRILFHTTPAYFKQLRPLEEEELAELVRKPRA